ncbi:hypothetical protein C7B82_18090 [Stenomitos frigidus ULC18]|uniref:Uncharacterized protein n=1 Tax=Stenomitos frigidus ULC18 TaxID=2107698 RepID=A0A2T1E2U2_9CYAN|nr:hypothetical protein C7B82_18090 [Stenomitos frigidus ULC18]
MLTTQQLRSPLAPLKKGGTRLLVPLFKGDLGGSKGLRFLPDTCVYTVVKKGGNRIRIQSPPF